MNINSGLFSDTDDNGGFGSNNPHLSHNGNNYYGSATDSDSPDNTYHYQNDFSHLNQVDTPIDNNPYGNTNDSDSVYHSYYSQNNFSHFNQVNNGSYTTEVNEDSYSSSIYSGYAENQYQLASSDNYYGLQDDKHIQSNYNNNYGYSNDTTQTTENIVNQNSYVNELRLQSNSASEGSDTDDDNDGNSNGYQNVNQNYQSGSQSGVQNSTMATIGVASGVASGVSSIVTLGVTAMTRTNTEEHYISTTQHISITENNNSQHTNTNINGDNIESGTVFGTAVNNGQIEHQDNDIGVGVSNADIETNKLAGNANEVIGKTFPEVTEIQQTLQELQSNSIETTLGKMEFPKQERYANIQGDNIEAKAVFSTVINKGQIEHQDNDVGVGVSNAEIETNELAGNVNEVPGKTFPEVTEIQQTLQELQSKTIENTIGKMEFPKQERFMERPYRLGR